MGILVVHVLWINRTFDTEAGRKSDHHARVLKVERSADNRQGKMSSGKLALIGKH